MYFSIIVTRFNKFMSKWARKLWKTVNHTMSRSDWEIPYLRKKHLSLMLLTAITAEGKNKWLKVQYYLLASSVGVASAILKLSLIMLPFGAYITTQSTFGGVRQQWRRSVILAWYRSCLAITDGVTLACNILITFSRSTCVHFGIVN